MVGEDSSEHSLDMLNVTGRNVTVSIALRLVKAGQGGTGQQHRWGS